MTHDQTRGERMAAANYPDPIDRASAEEAMQVEDLVSRQQAVAAAAAKRWAPRADGYCACGCDEEVDPRRLALGYGLTLFCAEKMERK